MVWANIAMAAINVIESYGQAQSKYKLAKAQYKYQKGQAENKAVANASQNMLNMASANVARYQQWRDNKKTLEAMGDQYSQDAWNFGKQIDAMNSQKFEQRVAAAGNLGSILAEAAAAGVGGASVEAVYETEKFKNDRQQWAMDNQIKDAEYAHRINQSAILDNGYNALDGGTQFSSLNYQAMDMVTDTSWQHKFTTTNLVLGTGPAMKAAVNGFSGNMDAVGFNVGGMMGGMGGKGGGANKGLGAKGGQTVKGLGAGQNSGATRL